MRPLTKINLSSLKKKDKTLNALALRRVIRKEPDLQIVLDLEQAFELWVHLLHLCVGSHEGGLVSY